MEREEVRFASGGESCAASLFRPSQAAGPVPCVAMGSGLSCVRDQGLDAFGERFAAAGIAALAFDYRHFGDSDGEPRGLMSAGRQRRLSRGALPCPLARLRRPEPPCALGLLAGRRPRPVSRHRRAGDRRCGLRRSDYRRSPHPAVRRRASPQPAACGGRRQRRPAGASPRRALPDTGRRPTRFPRRPQQPRLSSWLRGDLPTRVNLAQRVCARAALAPPYHLAGKTRRIGCPILYCILEEDDINPPALGIEAAGRAPKGELRRYPGGHFGPFLGETFDRMVSDQVDFLSRHLGGRQGL